MRLLLVSLLFAVCASLTLVESQHKVPLKSLDFKTSKGFV